MENYVGKRLDGRYEIQDIIGVGGMAVVYKAYDSIDDRIVAIKVLKEEFLAKEEFRRRFKNESKAIAILSHPNIVKVYDVSFGDRLQYIVMEHVEGITLKEYIEQCEGINWNEALFFAIQILRAIQHAHDKGIVHRDIKPQNIMLLDNGLIKVTDFGIARFSRGETRTLTEKAIGSVHYISPEQAKGQLTDEKADIYSIGVVLYEMLTGKLPFDAESAVSVALMQLQEEAVPLRSINPDIPIGFEQIALKAMQKNTRDRYQTASEMLLDLEEFKMNPNIKFDYQNYFVDKEPTRYIGKIQEKNIPQKSTPIKQPTGEYKPIKTSDYEDNSYNHYRDEVPQQRVRESSQAQYKQNNNVKKTNFTIIMSVVFAFLLILAIILGVFIKNGTIQLGPKRTEVDSFIGMDYIEDIEFNNEYMDKYTFEIVYVSSSDYEEGVVTDQDPKAGDTIAKDGVIKLYVAKSGEGKIIPDLVNKNYKQARDTLEAMGFIVKLQATENDVIEVGKVISTNPSANTSVIEGSTITVYYAVDTSAESQFKMPDLEGKSLDEAKVILDKNGLVVSKIETVDSSISENFVVGQSPADGSPVRKGDEVIITVSSGYTSTEINIQLPKVGVINVTATVDGNETFNQDIDTDAHSSYAITVKGKANDAKINIYLDNCLYYEAVGDFTKDNVRITNSKTHTVAFYKDVIGLNEIEAINILNNAGYRTIQINRELSSEPAGTVIAQSPTYLSAPHVDTATTIVLTVSKGATDTPVDDGNGSNDLEGMN
jgi:serine/threonine-protein kinase